MSNSSRLEYALGYREKGWCVIPIRAGGKTPLVKWQDYQHRKSTPDEVQAWWTQWPDANIGIVTGKISQLAVVDVDTHHGGEAGPIEAEFPTDMVARTGNGGYHLFYEYPSDHDYIPCQTSIAPGLDTRVDGGYVVVAPSEVEGGNPGRYRWLSTQGLGRGLPPFVTSVSGSGRSTQDGSKASDEWYISTIAATCKQGARNDTAARLAGSLLRRGHSPDEAAAVLKLWNQRNDPPLSEEEIDRVAASVWRTDQARRSRQSEESQVDELGYVDAAHLFAQDIPAVDWMIEGWLERNTLALVVAPPGSFKSYMLLDLCVAMTCHVPFLGIYEATADDPRPVIYYQQEDPIRTTALRLKRIVGRLSVDERAGLERVHILNSGRVIIGDPAGIDKLAEEIDRIRPSMVCIDPLYASVSSGRAGDEYMRSAADAMLALKKLRDEYDTTFVLAHHTKKSAGEEIQRLDAWGSQFINAALETGWQIRRSEQSSAIRVLRHSKQSGDTSPIWLRWEFPPNDFSAPIIEEISDNTIREELTDRAQTQAHAAAHNATNTILAERSKTAFFDILSRQLAPFTLHAYHRTRATGEYSDDENLAKLGVTAPKKDNVAKKIKTWEQEGLIEVHASDTGGAPGFLLTEEGKTWLQSKYPKKEES